MSLLLFDLEVALYQVSQYLHVAWYSRIKDIWKVISKNLERMDIS